MRPAAFLFDLDGTLVDTESAWARAISDWLADHGASASPGAVAPLLIGRSWIDIHDALHAAYPVLGASTPIDDAHELRAYYARVVADPASLVIPGSVAFLRRCARIAPCAIVSGSPHADVEAAVKMLGIVEEVAFVLGCEDVGRGKPAPDGFLKAANMLDVDSSECVVVEDSTAGVAAGRAAGMQVVGLDRCRTVRQDFSGCAWMVHDLAELDVKVAFGDTEEE